MTRLVTLLAVVLAAFAVGTSTAVAATGDPVQRARDELVTARVKVDRALSAVKRGDRDAAYRLARSAYLDHYEWVEIPMRLRDPNLVLDTEFRFAALRNAIRDGAPLSQIRTETREVRAGMDAVDRKLAAKGVAAPALAFGFSFSILFREGLEAVLLLAILLSALAAGTVRGYQRPLAYGALAAIGASAVLWGISTWLIDIAPFSRELLEAGTTLLAVGVLILVSFWLVSRLDQKRRAEFMRARTAAAMAAGTGAAFAGLGFLAVFREGFETVLFYQALSFSTVGLSLWVVLGAVAAAIALAAVGYAILKLGRQVPLKPLLIAGASILLLLSVTFAGNAVRSLQSADLVAATPVDGFRLPIFLAELTGIHPTVQGLMTQLAMLVVFGLGAVWVFAVQPARARRRVEQRAAVTSSA